MIRKLVTLALAGLLLAAAPSMLQASEQQTAAGKVVSVDTENGQLKIQDGDQSMVFQISANTKITRDGEPVELGAVRAGELATVHYQKGPETPLAVSVDLGEAAS